MIPLNTQKPEKSSRREDGALEVHSIFYTIQGEGPFAGEPAVFLRLTGCNLQCPSCDTEYTSNRILMTPEEIAKEIAKEIGSKWTPENDKELLVITGGEPLRQKLGPLIDIMWLWTVQIETNGTMWDDSLQERESLHIVCSPKGAQVHPQLRPLITDYKYILSADSVSPDDGLPLTVLGNLWNIARPHEGFQGDIFLQPQDDQDLVKNAANMQACVDSCLKYGYRLGYQLHKIAGLQ